MNKALLIVHLSSLDAFVWEHGDQEGHRLAEALRLAFSSPGPLIITDQNYPLVGKESRFRRQLLEMLQNREHVTWFAHDEERDEEWAAPMQQLGQVLRDKQLTHLRVGGFEASEDGTHGCVNETMRWLTQQGFHCSLDAALCSFAERAG